MNEIAFLKYAATIARQDTDPRWAAVADLLDNEARLHADDPSFDQGTDPLCDTWPHALRVARALLGQPRG